MPEDQKACDGLVFIETRKRKPGREYKTNTNVMNYRIETIVKKLNSSEGVDGIEELMSGGKKSHGPGWLIGRHDTKSVKNATETPAPIYLYVQELTKKIKQDVVQDVESKIKKRVDDEVDAKVSQKFQDNLTLVLKKLVEANPGLKIDIADICGTVSSDTGADGTPLTAGPST